MKKVLIITDSLGSPRCKPDYVRDDDVWTYSLADALKMNFDFRFFMLNGLDTNLLVNAFHESLDAYNADIVILQVGIVDCCPRSLTKKELLISKNLPKWISNFIHKCIKKYRKTLIRNRKIRYVSPSQFENNLKKIKEFFSDSHIIVLPIAPASSIYIKKTPLIEESINLYNEIKKEVFGESYLFDLYSDFDIEKIFLVDQHHLNTYGHSRVLEKIKIRLMNHTAKAI